MTITEAGRLISKLPYGLQKIVKNSFDQRLSMTAGGTFQLDIVKFDKLMQQHNPDYNRDKCTYKDQKEVSCEMAVELIYGKESVDIINKLM